MKISTNTQSDRIDEIIQAHKLSKPEIRVLTRIWDKNSSTCFLKNAESSAYSWAPTGQTHYAHHEDIESSLVEALSDKVIQMLAEVDITFRKKHGTWAHTMYGIFEVDKS